MIQKFVHLRSGWFDDTKIDHTEICLLLSISKWTKGIKLNDVVFLYRAFNVKGLWLH